MPPRRLRGLARLDGAPGVAETAAERLAEKFPGLTVSGTCDGFFKPEDTDEICAAIRRAETDILFVGLGVPKQEYWLEEYLGKTGAVVGMGIGGSMDVISGRLTRAPKIWQKVGMEWLYRVIQEPWRWRRLTKLPLFVWYLVLTYLHIDSYKNDDIKVDK